MNSGMKASKGGLKSMEGFRFHPRKHFFKLRGLSLTVLLSGRGWNVKLIQQIHVMTGSMIMPTFGLIFRKEGHPTVYFTTDSQHCSPSTD
jgi:hypothetical protein